jgi:uncharacterized protein YegP (UPF0339 family)
MRTTSLRLPAFILAAALAAFGTTTGCAAVDDDDWSEEDGEAGIPASMELWSTDGQWFFHLVAGNGNVLLSSEGYTDRLGALNGMISVLDNGAYSSRYAAVKGTNGKWHLTLKAANGEIIATTQQYSTKSNATRAIGSCTRGVASYLAAWESSTAARAQVAPTETGWRFNVHAANGENVLTSEHYTTEAAALNGAFSAVENGKDIAQYEIRAAADGRAYFVLKAANGEIVGTSQMYATKASAERGRNDLIALLPTIELL